MAGGIPGFSGGIPVFSGGIPGFVNANRKTELSPTMVNVTITLEDVYFGRIKTYKINRNEPCSTCNGAGLKPGRNINTCKKCNGKGISVDIKRMGNMIQQIQSTCVLCKGHGKIINNNDKCTICKGNKVIMKEKEIKLNIPKSVQHGEKIILSQEGNKHPDCITGDIIFLIKVEKHNIFKRNGINLVYTAHIPLIDALTETVIKIKHLNGTLLKITNKGSDKVLSYNCRYISGYGLPINKYCDECGDLVIECIIDYPKVLRLSEKEEQGLRYILPPSKNDSFLVNEKYTTVSLKDFNNNDNDNNDDNDDNDNNDDDNDNNDDENVDKNVGCVHQ